MLCKDIHDGRVEKPAIYTEGLPNSKNTDKYRVYTMPEKVNDQQSEPQRAYLNVFTSC